jgi:hypothetical protein
MRVWVNHWQQSPQVFTPLNIFMIEFMIERRRFDLVGMVIRDACAELSMR